MAKKSKLQKALEDFSGPEGHLFRKEFRDVIKTEFRNIRDTMNAIELYLSSDIKVIQDKLDSANNTIREYALEIFRLEEQNIRFKKRFGFNEDTPDVLNREQQ